MSAMNLQGHHNNVVDDVLLSVHQRPCTTLVTMTEKGGQSCSHSISCLLMSYQDCNLC